MISAFSVALTGLVLSLAMTVQAAELRVIGFNVEAGWKPDADLETIVRQVEALPPTDLWGFSEVTARGWPERLKEAAGPRFDMVLGSTSEDRLLAVFDSDKLTLLKSFELKHLQFGRRARPPLVLHLRFNATGIEFLFMVNHLHRRAKDKRSQQARGLNIWASGQTLPIIAVGDYNFDWNIPPNPAYRDRGYDLMTADDVFAWVRPDVLIKTHCGKMYNSVLDFVFVANAAKNWPRESRILDGCPDTPSTSDHRPVELTIEIP